MVPADFLTGVPHSICVYSRRRQDSVSLDTHSEDVAREQHRRTRPSSQVRRGRPAVNDPSHRAPNRNRCVRLSPYRLPLPKNQSPWNRPITRGFSLHYPASHLAHHRRAQVTTTQPPSIETPDRHHRRNQAIRIEQEAHARQSLNPLPSRDPGPRSGPSACDAGPFAFDRRPRYAAADAAACAAPLQSKTKDLARRRRSSPETGGPATHSPRVS
ncbi:phage integrase family domain protein [Burkholderia thailandensis 34]|nr:phage integrase family domain protein [Burkholderia thailandensis 34]